MRTRTGLRRFVETSGSILLVCLLASCGSEKSGDAGEKSVSAAVTQITITANDQMKFDTKEFVVPTSTEITIVLENIGKLPKQAMGHNLVILAQGTDPVAFANAGIQSPDNDYIARERAEEVVAKTKLLGPGESDTIRFESPASPGTYPFVCTFPGHAASGMRGVMIVR